MSFSTMSRKKSFTFRVLSSFIAFSFFFTSVLPPQMVQAQVIPTAALNLPAPGTMILPTTSFTPVLIKGITLYPDNPLQFDFIVDQGDTGLEGEALKAEAMKLIKYFMASLTVPEDQMWVNLSPHEGDKIIPQQLGYTEMGRDMLAQDYILKQLTASLMYPEKELGSKFWKRVYEKVAEKFGTTDLALNSFNKVWIVPEKAVVYEHDGGAYVVESRMKVLMEEDYVAMRKGMDVDSNGMENLMEKQAQELNSIQSQIVKEIIIPEIEREVNEGQTFAQLRQVSNAMILAAWYKMNLKESLLGQVYVDKNKTRGIELEDKNVKQKIYDQYLETFKVGVYNLIKEEYDPTAHAVIPRKYFSGGMAAKWTPAVETRTGEVTELPAQDQAALPDGSGEVTFTVQAVETGPSASGDLQAAVTVREAAPSVEYLASQAPKGMTFDAMRAKPTIHQVDTLVIGGGGAGMMAAAKLAKQGVPVAILSKVPFEQAHTREAQGGVAGVRGTDGDTFEIHFRDTSEGGVNLADADAIEILAKEAPEVLDEMSDILEEMGWKFDRKDDGSLRITKFGGHSRPRSHSVQDHTGLALHDALYKKLKQIQQQGNPVELHDEFFVRELIREGDQVVGAVAINLKDGSVHIFQTKAIVLATGGAGQLFAYTSNAPDNTGDGYALAEQIGVALQDMELFQFHPTGIPAHISEKGTQALVSAAGLAGDRVSDGTLISEKSRTEGGYLLNANGERFMTKYDPSRGELAPRDIVSRAIATEIAEGRGVALAGEENKAFVYLDMRHIQDLDGKLPEAIKNIGSHLGLDPRKDLIPIRPTAHYTMGGVPTDLDGRVVIDSDQRRPGFQPKTLKGLYAAGEAANVSVHGANRLVTNSLLELFVFGRRVAQAIPGDIKESTFVNLPASVADSTKAQVDDLLVNQGDNDIQELRTELRESMSENVEVFRNEATLTKQLGIIASLKQRANAVKLEKPEDIVEVLTLRNMLDVAQIVTEGALARKESRGGHYRQDFPKTDDVNYLRHTVASLNREAGTVKIDYKKVVGEQASTLIDNRTKRLYPVVKTKGADGKFQYADDKKYNVASVMSWLKGVGADLDQVSVQFLKSGEVIIERGDQQLYRGAIKDVDAMDMFFNLRKFFPETEKEVILQAGEHLDLSDSRKTQMPTKRWAWIIKQDGPAGEAEEAIELELLDMPQLKDDEVLLDVFAVPAEANAGRWLVMRQPVNILAIHKQPFHTPGNNPVGRIVGRGDTAGKFRDIGDLIVTHNVSTLDPLAPAQILGYTNLQQRVRAYDEFGDFPDAPVRTGGHAQFVVAKWWQVMEKPANLTFEEAAVYPLPDPTVRNMFTQNRLGEGMSLLLIGAAGSTGMRTIAVAKEKKLKRVVGLVSSEKKARQIEALSNETTQIVAINRSNYDLTTEDGVRAFVEKVRELNGGELVDVASDFLGREYTNAFSEATRRGDPNNPQDLGGRFTSYGAELGFKVSVKGTNASSTPQTMFERIDFFRDRTDTADLIAINRKIFASDPAALARIDEAEKTAPEVRRIKKVVIYGADAGAMQALEEARKRNSEVVLIIGAQDAARIDELKAMANVVGVVNVADHIKEGKLDQKTLTEAVRVGFKKARPDLVVERADQKTVLGVPKPADMLNFSVGLLDTGGQVVYFESTEGQTLPYDQRAWVMQKGIFFPDKSIILTHYAPIAQAYDSNDKVRAGSVSIEKPHVFSFRDTRRLLSTQGDGKNVGMLVPSGMKTWKDIQAQKSAWVGNVLEAEGDVVAVPADVEADLALQVAAGERGAAQPAWVGAVLARNDGTEEVVDVSSGTAVLVAPGVVATRVETSDGAEAYLDYHGRPNVPQAQGSTTPMAPQPWVAEVLANVTREARNPEAVLQEAENAVRVPVIGGNLKGTFLRADVERLLTEISTELGKKGVKVGSAHVFIAPADGYLSIFDTILHEMEEDGRIPENLIKLGAQNARFQGLGAFTGYPLSVEELTDLGAQYVILGHSENTRQITATPEEDVVESDEMINKKVHAVLDRSKIIPVVAVGETLDERKAEEHFAVIRKQLTKRLAGITAQQMLERGIVLAYEPVWSIGTGVTATPAQANEMQRLIRSILLEMYGPEVAAKTAIQYGGSMKPGNAVELAQESNIDGGLIGGASQKGETFMPIIHALVEAVEAEVVAPAVKPEFGHSGNQVDAKLIEAQQAIQASDFDKAAKLVKEAIKLLREVSFEDLEGGFPVADMINQVAVAKAVLEALRDSQDEEILALYRAFVLDNKNGLDLKAALGYVAPAETAATDAGVTTAPDTKGGIDLNSKMLDLQIKRDGNGIPLPLLDQPINQMRIQGFFPVIIHEAPFIPPAPFLGKNKEKSDGSQQLSYLDKGQALAKDNEEENLALVAQ